MFNRRVLVVAYLSATYIDSCQLSNRNDAVCQKTINCQHFDVFVLFTKKNTIILVYLKKIDFFLCFGLLLTILKLYSEVTSSAWI